MTSEVLIIELRGGASNLGSIFDHDNSNRTIVLSNKSEIDPTNKIIGDIGRVRYFNPYLDFIISDVYLDIMRICISNLISEATDSAFQKYKIAKVFTHIVWLKYGLKLVNNEAIKDYISNKDLLRQYDKNEKLINDIMDRDNQVEKLILTWAKLNWICDDISVYFIIHSLDDILFAKIFVLQNPQSNVHLILINDHQEYGAIFMRYVKKYFSEFCHIINDNSNNISPKKIGYALCDTALDCVRFIENKINTFDDDISNTIFVQNDALDIILHTKSNIFYNTKRYSSNIKTTKIFLDLLRVAIDNDIYALLSLGRDSSFYAQNHDFINKLELDFLRKRNRVTIRDIMSFLGDNFGDNLLLDLISEIEKISRLNDNVKIILGTISILEKYFLNIDLRITKLLSVISDLFRSKDFCLSNQLALVLGDILIEYQSCDDICNTRIVDSFFSIQFIEKRLFIILTNNEISRIDSNVFLSLDEKQVVDFMISGFANMMNDAEEIVIISSDPNHLTFLKNNIIDVLVDNAGTTIEEFGHLSDSRGVNNGDGCISESRIKLDGISFPKTLSVTGMIDLIHNPGVFCAKHIMRLKKINEILKSTSADDLSILIHQFANIISKEIRDESDFVLFDLEARLNDYIGRYDRKMNIFQVRLIKNVIYNVLDFHRFAISNGNIVLSEISYGINMLGIDINCIADRIEIDKDGNVTIYDYKLKQNVSIQNELDGHSPQLLIESVIISDQDPIKVDISRNKINVSDISYIKFNNFGKMEFSKISSLRSVNIRNTISKTKLDIEEMLLYWIDSSVYEYIFDANEVAYKNLFMVLV